MSIQVGRSDVEVRNVGSQKLNQLHPTCIPLSTPLGGARVVYQGLVLSVRPLMNWGWGKIHMSFFSGLKVYLSVGSLRWCSFPLF